MNKHHPLDEVFRKRLRDLEAEAPMHLWEKVSQKRDWKHRALNRARQKMPVAGLFAALVLAGLSWGVWSFLQPALGSFPVPLVGPVASMETGTPASHTADLPPAPPAGAPETAARQPLASLSFAPPARMAAAVRHNADNLALLAAAAPAIQQAVRPQDIRHQPDPSPAPALSPVREEAAPALPSALERHQKKGLSIFDGLFSPDPKCAEFGRGTWGFYLDALLSPDLTFRRLQPRDPEFEEYANTREETESNMYAFSGALRLSLVSDRGLALRTGLNYSQINERFSFVNGSEEVIETINNYDQAGNIISTDTIIKIGTRRKITQNHYRMLDIPFLLGYEFTSGKLKVSANGGAYLNLLFRQKGDFLSPGDLQPVRFDSGDPNAYPAFKQQVGLGWYGSVGFAYQMGPNLQLVVEPHVKIFPKSVTREQYGVQQRYMTTGLFVGVRQRL
ncbi:MAG: hypothetical protein KDD10_10635 [Phaeodactylibacter sp.]|nr:hypothetical protein [Phaeodactylibacter sp.]MCB9296987.1 hypothetical protein [Lewinellaceae bacterium]